MKEHQVRRLPVIDGHDLVGIVSQADIAKNAEEEEVGELVEAILAVADRMAATRYFYGAAHEGFPAF